MSDYRGSSTRTGAESRPSPRQLATGLGLFSIGLGLIELLVPRQLGRALGLEGRETLLRSYGLREVATGVAILASHDPTPWLWGRVAGDALDLLTLTSQGPGLDRRQRSNMDLATAAVVGVTALDLLCAGGLMAEGRDPSESLQRGSERTGSAGSSPVGRPAPPAGQSRRRSARPRSQLRIEQSNPRLIRVYDAAAGHEFRFRVDVSGGIRVLGAFAPRWAGGHEPSSSANYLFEARQIAEREAADQGWIDG